MALLTGVAGLLGRFAGRFLNSTLGWATILLFGKVPQGRQTLLLIMVLAALGWVAALVGVIFPNVGALLIAAVPLPAFIDEGWVRLAMLVAALVLPLLIGAMALFISDSEHRPRGLRILATVLRGYPFTLVLTLTIVILAAVALVRKARSLARRWQDSHVPLVVKPGGYERLLRQLHRVLGEAGLDLRVVPAPRVLSLPPKLLDAVAGRALGTLVPDRLMLLAADGLEILVYPSDLAISGTAEAVARARAAVASELTHAPAWLTTSAEAQDFEDRLRALGGVDAGDVGRDVAANVPQASRQRRAVRALDEPLARLTVPFDEWEILYRQRLQIERDALRELLDRGGAEEAAFEPDPRRRRDVVIAVAGLGLIGLDLALLIMERRRRD